jgi:hypothetical protein
MSKIKIQIEVPSKWFDIDHTDLIAYTDMRLQIKNILREAIAEQYIKEIELPEIKISKAELKKAIIDKKIDKLLDE